MTISRLKYPIAKYAWESITPENYEGYMHDYLYHPDCRSKLQHATSSTTASAHFKHWHGTKNNCELHRNNDEEEYKKAYYISNRDVAEREPILPFTNNIYWNIGLTGLFVVGVWMGAKKLRS